MLFAVAVIVAVEDRIEIGGGSWQTLSDQNWGRFVFSFNFQTVLIRLVGGNFLGFVFQW